MGDLLFVVIRFVVAAPNVLGMRHRLQVGWIDAVSYSAKVIEFKARRDGTN
jgi:hypothetical protein